MKLVFITFISVVFTLGLSCSLASTLSVNPVLLTLTHKEPMATLTLTNTSDDKVTVQANVLKWSQKEGVDVHHESEDMIISPPLFQLAPHESQLLRIAWLKASQPSTELTYRVILREIVPRTRFSQAVQQSDLRIALAFSIPLFIKPIKEKPYFKWTAKWMNDHTLKLNFNNLGNTTLFINDIRLLSNRTQTFAYILPKQHHDWLLTIKKRNFASVNAMINGEWKTKSVQVKM